MRRVGQFLRSRQFLESFRERNEKRIADMARTYALDPTPALRTRMRKERREYERKLGIL
jgi:hypothetical protein